MDRTWMITSKKGEPEYDAGLAEFYDFVSINVPNLDSISCPCDRCININRMSFSNVKIHLKKWSFDPTYKKWIFHGESRDVEIITKNNEVELEDNFNESHEINTFSSPSDSDSGHEFECEAEHETDQVREGDGVDDDDRSSDEDDSDEEEISIDDPTSMLNKLNDFEMPLYTGCDKYTKLSAVVKLYNLKALNGWSNKSFTELLELLHDMLPVNNVLPTRTYDAKKMLKGIGMKYEKIHACPNDCILYRKEFSSLSHCPTCNEWRYQKKEGIPAKVLWHFPIIPKLTRLFANENDAQKLTWHKTEKYNDGKLRHPSDGKQWKDIDVLYPDFSKDPRNIRLALSTDGMNPFGNMSSQHSTWPVILAIYNLSPEFCMKRKYLMLSLLISGPKQPGNDIDVYLAPLIDELMLLWDNGVLVFDAFRKEIFNLKAMLLCTITDFPAYGNLCGHTVHGKQACPLCEDEVESHWLPHSRKTVFLGHRRFLPSDHHYRRQQKIFNGKPEHRPPPKIKNGHEVYERVKDIHITYGKMGSKLNKQGYKKKSPFFELPYWSDLPVRHCLDFMHIEKNVCDNIIDTLLNVPNKSKDNVGARYDMVDMNIRPELAPQKKGNRTYLPPAIHTLSRKEKKEFCECLKGIKVPEGYSSNISNLVSMKDLKLIGLKSHDCHTLMQQLLPVAIRSILPKKVRYSITRICFFFNEICSKTIDPSELEFLQNLIVTTLCQFEMFFPPSFFTIMIHLTVHLVREIEFLGPVYLRYQYPFERLMKVYKDYTTNRYRPEGCIAERVIIDDALSFCYDHIEHYKLIGLPKHRHSEWLTGKGIAGHSRRNMPIESWRIAHTFVLHNEDDVETYILEHQTLLKSSSRNKSEMWIANEHNKTFLDWFKSRVIQQLSQQPDCISPRLRRLCYGPNTSASSYSGYAINGFTFYTRDKDTLSTMQNSGVCLEAEAMYFASSKDKNPVFAKTVYYGVIQEIWVLDYVDFQIPIFGCKWVDINNGVKKDDSGTTLVNLDRIGHTNDPYILASQARQVFYVTDTVDNKWSVVLSVRRRITPDVIGDEDVVFEGVANPNDQFDDELEHIVESDLYTRNDHDDGIWIDIEPSPSISRKRQRG